MTRELSGPATYQLRPGDDNYRAYVGPPGQYDLMGATQFMLLCQLGIRETNSLLDIGCGSLRLGRFMLPYLLPGKYYGVEPNNWLVEEAFLRELGHSLRDIKTPNFSDNADFDFSGFGVQFDFAIAQSIFSHTGADMVHKAFASLAACMSHTGIVVATFIHPRRLNQSVDTDASGWIYPECVCFFPESVAEIAGQHGFETTPLLWHHPRQDWYAFTRDASATARVKSISKEKGLDF